MYVLRDWGCNVMGTASTMAAVFEAFGMMLPGSSAFAADDSGRMTIAEESGRLIVALTEQNLRPSDIMTAGAFDNLIRLCIELGGSTNAIIHLVAIVPARVGIVGHSTDPSRGFVSERYQWPLLGENTGSRT